MARLSSAGCVAISLLAVAVVFAVCTDASCEKDIIVLTNTCYEFVKKLGPKTPPSAMCCAAMKGADIPCVCKYLTSDLKKIISMEKVHYVGQKCKVNIPSTCGSGEVKV